MRYEKGQTGCMWGLISMFDFRHGRSTRRLLSDRKRESWQSVGKKLGYQLSFKQTLSRFYPIPHWGKNEKENHGM